LLLRLPVENAEAHGDGDYGRKRDRPGVQIEPDYVVEMIAAEQRGGVYAPSRGIDHRCAEDALRRHVAAVPTAADRCTKVGVPDDRPRGLIERVNRVVQRRRVDE